MSEQEETGRDELVSGEMSLFEHLAELRKRLIYSMLAIATGFGISWIWREEIFQFLLEPLRQAAPAAVMAQIHNRDLTEPFMTLIKASFVAGVFLAIPVVLWQLWCFIAPALYKNEKRLAIPFVVVATVFFFAGGALCYKVVMPYGFEFLFAFGQGISNPTLMMGDHFSLTIKLLLAFGAIFELPVISMFLSALGVLTHYTLIKHWRGAIVGSFVLGAVLTPPDVGTQVAMASSLIVLYGLSIIVAWYFTTRRERKLAKELAALAKR